MSPDDIVEMMQALKEHDQSITKVLEFQIMKYLTRILVKQEINGTFVGHQYLEYHKDRKEFTYWP